MKQLGNGISSIKTNTRDYDEAEYQKEAKKYEVEVTNKASELFSSSLFSQSETKGETADDKDENDEAAKEENKVLVNYALLTQEELEVTFGEYKPCASLNPYMVKVWFS